MPSGNEVVAMIGLGALAIGCLYAAFGVVMRLRMGIELESHRDYEGNKRWDVVDDKPYPTARHMGHVVVKGSMFIGIIAGILATLYSVGKLITFLL